MQLSEGGIAAALLLCASVGISVKQSKRGGGGGGGTVSSCVRSAFSRVASALWLRCGGVGALCKVNLVKWGMGWVVGGGDSDSD